MKPILFSTEMVQAILEDRKTQTRRIMKPQPNDNGVSYMANAPLDWEQVYKEEWKPWKFETDEGESFSKFCPYGEPGDVLWVRETWQGCFFDDEMRDGRKGAGFLYKANPGDQEILNSFEDPGWRPSIFMPKKACRLFLKIKAIRVEKLQNITTVDAVSEGIERITEGQFSDAKKYGFRFKDYLHNSAALPVASFRSLWQKINGEQCWYDNPWIWVVEFERCNKPKNFLQ